LENDGHYACTHITSNHSHSLIQVVITMRVTTLFLSASCIVGSLAFPAKQLEDLEKRGLLGGLLKATSGILQNVEEDLENVLGALNLFKNQPIDVSGQHAFQPPKETDQRGPCPGVSG
jgi:hypothetical protein